MSGFRGHNQEGRTGVRMGPLSQKELVTTLRALYKSLTDASDHTAAMSASSYETIDSARAVIEAARARLRR